MAEQRILKEATIAPSAVRYQILVLAAGFSATIVAIPLLPIILPIGAWYWKRYYSRLSVRLTSRELKVDRGLLVREEKAIPLEKITDLAVVQGPIMRYMGLKGIRVETAGQSGSGSALVNIVGIDDVDDFRDRVLSQRDRITDRDEGALPAARSEALPSAGTGVAAVSGGNGEMLGVLREIRDSLLRLEDEMKRG